MEFITMGRVLLGMLLVLILATTSHAQDSAGIEFFEKKIRPLLAEHCYSCHATQGKKQRGGLTLDTREGVLKGGDTGPALVPGKPNESLLIRAVRFDDTELRMPPKGKLPQSAIADLEKWVKMGAPDPRTAKAAVAKAPAGRDTQTFWCYQPVTKQPVPAVKNSAWPRDDIDRFILAKLESKGLRPVIDADRATLLRRTYFALIGLPPTPEETAAFVKDTSPDAFVKVVDRLLESKHFGERWGRFWL